MRRTSLLAAVAVLAADLAVATPAHAADTAVDLPYTTLNDLVVDVAHSRVFSSGDGEDLVARGLDGTPITTRYVPGIRGLALSPDGSRLYVAEVQTAWEPHYHAITAWDPVTLQKVATYETGAQTCPRSLAAVGSVVWFGYGCTTGDVGLLDLSGETPVVTLGKAPEAATALDAAAPQVEVTPDGSRLLAAVTGRFPSTLYSFAVADGALGAYASRAVGSDLQDLALTPDGTKVVTASTSPEHHARFAVADLAEDGTYGTELPAPSAVTASADHVAAGTNAVSGHDLRVYRADGTFVRRYELGGRPFARGLAFAPDGTTLYAVTPGPYGARLHVLRDANKPVPTLTLNYPTAPTVGTPFTLTGSLAGPEEGATLHVTRSSQYGTVTLPDVTTGPGGAFAVTDTVGKRGGYTYVVTYDGDDTYVGASAGRAFGVKGLVPALSITTDKSRYAFHASALVTARLATWSSRRRLVIQARNHLGNTTLRTADVDAGGYLKVSYTITRRTELVAIYSGDDVYEPRTVSVTRDAYAGVRSTLHGYYGTSGAYRLYRRAVHPSFYVDVDPDRYGACLLFVAQQYRSGAWRTVATNTCLRTDHNGSVYAALYGTHPVNVPHRIRATFQGDSRNLRTDGAWMYLRFT